jgi:hypothetical protein
MHYIQEVLNGYFKAWNNGFVSKNSEGIKGYMSKSFVGYWAHANLDKPDQYDYHYDLDGVLQQYDNAEKSFETFSVVERKNGQECVVLGREKCIINGELYAAQCMFVWRKEEGEWRLQREYIELER